MAPEGQCSGRLCVCFCFPFCCSVSFDAQAIGKLFHSGLPHKGINALEMVQDSLRIVQDRFYNDFPPHPDEFKYKLYTLTQIFGLISVSLVIRYSYATPSTMKPTQVSIAQVGNTDVK